MIKLKEILLYFTRRNIKEFWEWDGIFSSRFTCSVVLDPGSCKLSSAESSYVAFSTPTEGSRFPRRSRKALWLRFSLRMDVWNKNNTVSLPVLKPGFCLSYFRPCFQLPLASGRISHSAATSHYCPRLPFFRQASSRQTIYRPEADCRWGRRSPWPFWAGRMLWEVWCTTRQDLHLTFQADSAFSPRTVSMGDLTTSQETAFRNLFRSTQTSMKQTSLHRDSELYGQHW